MKITLLDTQTGVTKEIEGVVAGFTPYWWAEGNGSCDCNRRVFMGVPHDPSLPQGVCEGCHRFLIVACDNPTLSLLELNEGYPRELLEKHGVISAP